MAYTETSKAARMCPKCAERSIVKTSYEQPDGSIFRKRKCLVCGCVFATVERLVRILPE